MKHIVAIGGGEIGRPGKPVETTLIDKEIISLSNKKHPRVLFLPTASDDDIKYCNIFKAHYAGRLSCEVKDLKLYEKLSFQEIKEATEWADVIYVGGGNTLKMMMLWRKLGVDKLLKEAYERSVVLCGLSAGALCWFTGGLSDSRSFTSNGQTWNYIKVSGLKLEDVFICPHFDAELARQPSLKKALKGTSKVAVTIDNCAALEIKDGLYRILSSRKGAGANRTYWKKGKYIIEPITVSREYGPISELSSAK